MRKHKWITNFGITIVTILLCFSSFEGFLRIFHPYLLNDGIQVQEGSIYEDDSILGWKLKPNSVSILHYYKGGPHPDGETITFKINSKGLRDNEYEYDKPLGSRRILLLGDSFTFGAEVDQDETISQNMNFLLRNNNCQVLNCGVSGYGTIQEYLFLAQEGMKYSPDIVITLLFAYNDGLENIGIDLGGMVSARPLIQNGRIIPAIDSEHKNASSSLNPLEYSALYLSKNSTVFHVLGTTYYRFLGRRLDIEYERQVRDTVFALGEIDKMCKNANIKHLVVLVPHGITFNNDDRIAKSTKQYINKFTGDIISNLTISNIDFIDLQPLLRNSGTLEDLYFIDSGVPTHFTPKGTRVVAEILVERIRKIIESDLDK
jgi:hypothetical protein